MNGLPPKINIFISYSHQDSQYLERDSLLGFLKGLEQEGDVEFWFDRQLTAGDLWDDEIKRRISTSHIALVLVSQAFLDSPYCKNVEIEGFLKRKKSQGLMIFPVILSACEWEQHDWLSSTQHLPEGDKTIEAHYPPPGPRKEIYREIRRQLSAQIARVRANLTPPPGKVKLRHVWRDAWMPLAIVLSLCCVMFALEQTVFFSRFQLAAFRLLKSPRVLFEGSSSPVVLFDIQDIQAGPNGITPRDKLNTLIENVAKMKPVAIGLNIDFTPDSRTGMWKDPDNDPDFFDNCKTVARREGVKIVLGSGNCEYAPPETWLGLPDYKELAASIRVPKDTSRMPRYFLSGTERCPSMSYSLAQAYLFPVSGVPLVGRMFEQFSQARYIPELKREEFLMDYSHLQELMGSKNPVPDPATIQGSSWSEKLEGKIVLVGDSQITSQDHNSVAGHAGDVASLYIHASAIDTLIRMPLFTFKTIPRVVWDLVCVLFLIGVSIKAPTRLIARTYYQLNARVGFQWMSIILLGALAGGWIVILVCRLLWLDFFPIVAGLWTYFAVLRFANTSQ
jgi:CHASE2 domain-containing sensor protein